MAFTLDSADPGPRDRVRQLIPDVTLSGYLFEDEELDGYLSLEANDVRQAAALACESKAAEVLQFRGNDAAGMDNEAKKMISQGLKDRASTLRMQFLEVI